MNAPIYTTVVKHITACVEGPLDMFHVHFEPSIAAIVNGPFTSLALITKLKPGKSGEDLTAVMSSLTGAKGVPGCHGGAFGKVVEKEGQFAFMTGWDKVEVLIVELLCVLPTEHDFQRTTPQLAKSTRGSWSSWASSMRPWRSGARSTCPLLLIRRSTSEAATYVRNQASEHEQMYRDIATRRGINIRQCMHQQRSGLLVGPTRCFVKVMRVSCFIHLRILPDFAAI